ncbi:MAG: ParB/RepB/Spo0J family partition protein [Nannocystaceae bacterium]
MTTTQAYRFVALDQIDGDPFNVRTQLSGIESLAESIREHGLLENLVVVQLSEPRVEYSSGQQRRVSYEVRAGSRRYAALELLVAQGHYQPGERVPVLVVDTDGLWENLVENLQRVSVRPWDIGRRLNEFAAAGMTNRQIGTRLGHSNGWVSRYQTIARGLHPDTVKHLETLDKDLAIGELFRLAHILDSDMQPDGPAQLAALGRRKPRQRRKTSTPEAVRALSNRLHYLQVQMPVPTLLQPVVTAIANYLTGGGKPNLRKLEAEILDTKNRFEQSFRHATPPPSPPPRVSNDQTVHR